jgi:hypothetical protein
MYKTDAGLVSQARICFRSLNKHHREIIPRGVIKRLVVFGREAGTHCLCNEALGRHTIMLGNHLLTQSMS